MKVIEGDFSAKGKTFGIVVSRYNANVTKLLLEGAVECLEEHGADPRDISVVWVPGAAEIPQALKILTDAVVPISYLRRKPTSPGDLLLAQKVTPFLFDAIIVLGCVIRGDTTHYDAVVSLTTQGFARAADGRIPMAFGVLTTENLEQAMARAGNGAGNKGWEAALAALEMSGLWDKLGMPESRVRGKQE